jgi:hypothetical protein
VSPGPPGGFSTLRLGGPITLIVTEARRQGAEELIRARGWSGVTVDDVLEMPSIFIGSVDRIGEDTEARRERYGFSYYVIADRHLDLFAPVVARLAST